MSDNIYIDIDEKAFVTQAGARVSLSGHPLFLPTQQYSLTVTLMQGTTVKSADSTKAYALYVDNDVNITDKSNVMAYSVGTVGTDGTITFTLDCRTTKFANVVSGRLRAFPVYAVLEETVDANPTTLLYDFCLTKSVPFLTNTLPYTVQPLYYTKEEIDAIYAAIQEFSGQASDDADRAEEAAESLNASVSKTGSTATITITDGNGTTTATVSDGEDGEDGAAATIAVGTTTTGAAGTSASVTNTGSSSAAVFNFTIPKGADGTDGSAATIAVGTTTTGEPGTSASVTNSGTSSAAIFDFTIPKGQDGADGEDGADATITIGTVTTGEAGSQVSVTNSGTATAAVFDFAIPKGDTGAAGADGSAATIAVGDVTTGDPGTSVIVTNTGTSSAAVLDFTIPRGAAGEDGEDGVSPVATVTQTATGATISITDATGTTTASITNGQNGEAGTAATIAIGTVAKGDNASVTNSGTTSSAVFDFILPKGDKGDTGAKGDTGETGQDGTAATITIGTVTTGDPGTSATVTNRGTSSAAIFDFTIPRGEQGSAASAVWGNITGTLSSQTDLQTALDGKADSATTLAGYGITDAYTKTQVDAKTYDKIVDGQCEIDADGTVKRPGTWTMSAFTKDDSIVTFVAETASTPAPYYDWSERKWFLAPAGTFSITYDDGTYSMSGANCAKSYSLESPAVTTVHFIMDKDPAGTGTVVIGTATGASATTETDTIPVLPDGYAMTIPEGSLLQMGSSGKLAVAVSSATAIEGQFVRKTQTGYDTVTIDNVYDATITFTQGGTTKGSFTTNQSAASTIALDAAGDENVIEAVTFNGTTAPISNKTAAITATIPTVNDSTITFTQGGASKGSFTLNQSSAATIALDAGVSSKTKTAFATSPSSIDEGGIYTSTLTSGQAIVLPSPSDTTKVTTAELWLTMPSTAVSFTLSTVTWISTPDFTTASKTYCVAIRWDGTRWLANLAYSVATPVVTFSASTASFTSGTSATSTLSATPSGCTFATSDTLPSGVTLSSAGVLSYDGTSVATTATTTVNITASKSGYTSATAAVAITMTALASPSLIISTQGTNGISYSGAYEQGSNENGYPTYSNGTYELVWDTIEAGDGWNAFTGYVLRGVNSSEAIAGFSSLTEGATAQAVGEYGEMYAMDWETMQVNFVTLPTTFPSTLTVTKGSTANSGASSEDTLECAGTYTKTSSTCNDFPVYRLGSTNFYLYVGRCYGLGKALCWSLDTSAPSSTQTIDIWGGLFAWVKYVTTTAASLAPTGTYSEYGMGADVTEVTVS